MKQVSDAYSACMKSPMRNQSFVEVKFSNVDTSAAGDGALSSNGAQSYSEFETIKYDYKYKETYATLELNRWSLDGNTVIVPSGTKRDGFISSNMSNQDGLFSTQAVLTSTFVKAHALRGLTLIFDTRCKEWVIGVTVAYYLNGKIVKTLNLTVSDTKLVSEETVDACDKVVITFGSTLPYRRPRLERIIYGVEKTFTNNDIISTKQSHDVDPITRRLPQETMELVILDFEHNYDPDNPDGIYKYIDQNSPISIRFGYELPNGTVEWLKEDNYVLDGRPKVKNNQATFSATGLIGSLNGMFYKSKLGRKSLYDMAVEVLTDANLPLAKHGGNAWVIDNSLKQIYTTAALPINTHMVCLQLIAHAACCQLYTTDDNIICIEPFDLVQLENTSGFSLDFSTIAENSQSVSKIEQLKAVSVAKYSYTADADARTLYEDTTTDTQLHVEFSSIVQDVQITVSGGSLVSSNVYARAVDLVLTTGTKSVVITGKSVSENSVILSYPVQADGEVDTEENTLITSDSMCTALATHVVAYLTKRNTYDVEYRGNPELETRDIIGLQTPYTAQTNAIILTDEITFDGALSGKLKVKSLT